MQNTAPPESTDGSPLILILLAGDQPGRRFSIGTGTLILGRDPNCDVPIDDRRVSRHHARIEPEDDGTFLLVDNASSNGTTINGKLIREQHLSLGDRIGLGRGIFLLFTQAGQLDEQLLQSQKLQALGHLSGKVAHDFNNLLTSILTNVSYLRYPDTSPIDASRAIEDIELAAKRGAEITESLLTFANRRGPMRDVVNMSDVVREAVRLLQATTGSLVKIKTDVESDLYLFGRHSQLVNAVLNLGLNANDAMPRGGTLTLKLCSEEVVKHAASSGWLVPGIYIVLTIEDDGTGIPSGTLDRIFEPFFTTKIGGTGMGLANVYSTIRGHGGTIQVRSTPDVGTRFQIVLPSTED